MGALPESRHRLQYEDHLDQTDFPVPVRVGMQVDCPAGHIHAAQDLQRQDGVGQVRNPVAVHIPCRDDREIRAGQRYPQEAGDGRGTLIGLGVTPGER